MDILQDSNTNLIIKTFCAGVFEFQLGFETNNFDFKLLLQRVNDAQSRFASSPLASIAEKLEKEVVVSSIFGTDNIEGGQLSEEETADVLELTPEEVQTISQKRVLNIKSAYDFIKKQAAKDSWQLQLNDILQIHCHIGYELDGYQVGILRDNEPGLLTKVGNKDHGGAYKPPQKEVDIKPLLCGLIKWNQQLVCAGVPALIRAPLVHLYFELIHPFRDGNGRVGRVIEAGILYAEGFKYSPFAQAKYYLNNIDAYFTLFNTCRKAADKKKVSPNIAFINFFLVGMLETINNLHDRVNVLIKLVLFDTKLHQMKQVNKINDRQSLIVKLVILQNSISLIDLKSLAQYQLLYVKLTDKTKSRDLKKLYELGLIIEKNNKIYPCL